MQKNQFFYFETKCNGKLETILDNYGKKRTMFNFKRFKSSFYNLVTFRNSMSKDLATHDSFGLGFLYLKIILRQFNKHF